MSDTFSPEQLLPILQRLPEAKRYWIAYSGGLDSTVLLHAISRLGEHLTTAVTAVHVDHGLSAHSAEWSAHCRRQCEVVGVEFHEKRVAVDSRGRGIEAAAREARYAAFTEVVGEGEMLLTAHHQDDQAETLLLQLLRGGGVRGLAAMPGSRCLGKGWLGRPLLSFSRETLQAYAEKNALEWIEDPSNFDISLERNYLRHELLPLLEQRREGVATILARSAGHFAESAYLLDELASQDMAAVAGEEGEKGEKLSIKSLASLDAPRQRNLLRYWLRSLGITVPDTRNLQRILGEVLPAAVDAMPQVSWHGGEVRRYRDELHAMTPLGPLPEDMELLQWQGEAALGLPSGMGSLRMVRAVGSGISEELLQNAEVTIGWRRGGELMALPGREGHHSLKKLYQEEGVPPWERSRRPLLYIDGELAQVAGFWTDIRFSCGKNEQGICFEWSYAIEKASENNDN